MLCARTHTHTHTRTYDHVDVFSLGWTNEDSPDELKLRELGDGMSSHAYAVPYIV